MQRLGIGLIGIMVSAATLLYFFEHRQWTGRAAAVEQRTGALEARAEAGEEHTQVLEQQAAEQQQRTAQLERDARERAAQVSKIASDVKQTQDQSQRMAQQMARWERQASPETAALVQDVVATTPLKISMVEYYMSEGRWPSTNADIGMPAPDQYHGDKLRSATVLPNGVIELKFAHGDNQTQGIVRLVADASNQAMGVRWRCESPNFPDIGRVLSACNYAGH